MLSTLIMALLAMLPAAQGAQKPFELAPGARYDSRIPSLKDAIGHDFGEQISTPEQIAAYMKALAAADPDRTRLLEYGRTWEGRPLILLIVGGAGRISGIDGIKAGLQKLADPRSLAAAEADRLVKELPAVVWLIHAVHGNEISSPDAALAEAYHLLAARGDAAVDAILQNTLVLVDPLQNPDGRARFLAANQQGRAAVPDSEPVSAEHDEPWPGGRSNHYLFDMNRDWLAMSQIETKARARIGLEWHPQVVVDLHEMGGESTYYFAPPAEPANPYITPRQREWLQSFGKENARHFDARGFEYFVREVFDSFYPGYGDSWPMLQGAIAMTYEQASPRGLVYRRGDDTLLSFRDAVVHHFTAALSTLETAARNRETLLRDYLEYRRSAIAEGEKAQVREYWVPAGVDGSRAIAFANKLLEHGIEVRRAEESLKSGATVLPAGTFVIPAAQPAYRLLRNLMEPEIRMDDAFLKEQERRRQKRLGDRIYDVTAWSLPLLYDLEVVPSAIPAGVRTRSVGPAPLSMAPSPPTAKVGYLMPWGLGTAGAAVEALRAGVRMRTAGEPFTIGSRKFEVGTAIVRTSDNSPEVLAQFRSIVARHDVEIVRLDSSWVDEGMSLGSNEATLLKTPKVVLAWDAPSRSESAGWARFVLERQFGQPVTAVRASSLRRLDMRRYNVLILPSGSYTFSEEDVRRMKDWVSTGGVLVTFSEASRWATGERVGLLSTGTELRDGRPAVEPPKDEKKPAPDPKKPFDYDQAIQPDRESPESVPGALMRVTLDREHWLASGLDEEIQVVVEGSRVFTPVKLDRGRNVGIYAKKDRLLAGGHAWQNSQELLPQKAFLIDQPLGRGHVIAFAEDPNFRALSPAMQLLFINAVLMGTSR